MPNWSILQYVWYVLLLLCLIYKPCQCWSYQHSQCSPQSFSALFKPIRMIIPSHTDWKSIHCFSSYSRRIHSLESTTLDVLEWKYLSMRWQMVLIKIQVHSACICKLRNRIPAAIFLKSIRFNGHGMNEFWVVQMQKKIKWPFISTLIIIACLLQYHYILRHLCVTQDQLPACHVHLDHFLLLLVMDLFCENLSPIIWLLMTGFTSSSISDIAREYLCKFSHTHVIPPAPTNLCIWINIGSNLHSFVHFSRVFTNCTGFDIGW